MSWSCDPLFNTKLDRVYEIKFWLEYPGLFSLALIYWKRMKEDSWSVITQKALFDPVQTRKGAQQLWMHSTRPQLHIHLEITEHRDTQSC